MKKSLLKLLTGTLILTTSVSVAQPILTAVGTNPVIGNSIAYTGTSFFGPGSAGANQTWNFSTISGSVSGPSTCITVGSTPNGASFPSANIAFNNTASSNYSYQKTSSAAYQNYGNVTSAGVIMSFSNPEDFLRFPFTYNNTYTDPWATTFVNGGYTFYRYGNTTITADGYGTLITPAGTFTNVTRIHMHQVYKDSTNFGSTPYVIDYDNDEYMWYMNGTHASLAACFTFTTSQGGGPTQSGFFLGTAVGVNDINAYLSSFNLFPNPAVNNMTIDFNLTENKNAEAKLFNSVGQQVLTGSVVDGLQGSNTITLDIASLPEGIYFAQIVLDGNIAATRRFVVSK